MLLIVIGQLLMILLQMKNQFKFELTDTENTPTKRAELAAKILERCGISQLKPRFNFLIYPDGRYSMMAYREQDAQVLKDILNREPKIFEIDRQPDNVMRPVRMD